MFTIHAAFRHGLSVERLLFGAFLLSTVGAAAVVCAIISAQQSLTTAQVGFDRLDATMKAATQLQLAVKDVEITRRADRAPLSAQEQERATAATEALRAKLDALRAITASAEVGVLGPEATARNDMFIRLASDVNANAGATNPAVFDQLMTALDAQAQQLGAQVMHHSKNMVRAIVGAVAAGVLALALAYGLILHEIRARRSRAKRDAHAARHDVLTGLPNRSLFHEWMDHALAQARREANTPALIYLDLDGFKPINDSLGHRAGDHVLKEVARRFRGSARQADMLARLGGDEFAVLMPSVHDLAEARLLAQRIIESVRDPIDFEGRSVSVGASAGIALAGDATQTSEALIAAADQAMYRAKQAGRGVVCV